jgi:hypothetical protein
MADPIDFSTDIDSRFFSLMNGIQITALVQRKVVIPYADFPRLLTAHLTRNPNTQTLESNGRAIRTSTTMTWQMLEPFIRQVCSWGDYSGIAGRVIKNNARLTIIAKMKAAIAKLNAATPDLIGALKNVLEIKQLGVSFASKHLRFFLPEYCVVLDSILSDRLFYEMTPEAYGDFCIACKNIANELNQANIPCSFPGSSSWRASDVEAALYAWVNDWR